MVRKIIEIKYAEDENLQKACEKALGQIENSHYDEELKDEGLMKCCGMASHFIKKDAT